LSFTE